MNNTTLDNTTFTIRAADLSDSPRISRTLAAAFQDDPVFSWCIPSPARREQLLPSLFDLFAEAVLPLGASELTDGGKAIALWVPAGQPPIADEHSESFMTAILDLVGDDAERTAAIMALLDEHHPTSPHEFLWFIGVDPAAQGSGLGSALLASTLRRCDEQGTAAYLDATSEHSRRLYERHGFVVTGEQSVDGSPTLWAMWREPRPVG